MTQLPTHRPILVLSLLLVPAIASPCGAAERVSLTGAAITADPGAPSWLRHAVGELAAFIGEATGKVVTMGPAPEARSGTRIAIGPIAARDLLGEGLRPENLGDEGYVLRSAVVDGAGRIAVAGVGPRGTRAGVLALMRAIELDAASASLPAGLDIRRTPAFAKRGIHLNGWAFRSPYSFRSWKEEDWRRYLDILALQGVNLFYLWPFMEIMPVPLSPEDRSYLEECRRVVAYAQEAHGMEVWLMQCTNRVARDRCGVADPRERPYWRKSQEDLNPGDPKHLQAILDSREALYRAVDNADGICNIDSDPGYFPGSPIEDYLKVLQGCRALLDRHNVHGREAKLVHWMWCGWGHAPDRAFDQDLHTRTLRLLRQGLPEPWGVVCGRFEDLEVCRKEGVLGKTVLLHYGLIEDEPSYPATNIFIDPIRSGLEAHAVPGSGLLGVMGNVQTPLLQLPDENTFTSWIQEPASVRGTEREVLVGLGRRIEPEQAELLADGWLALGETDPARIAGIIGRLEVLLRSERPVRTGVLGRKLFPDPRIAHRMLLLQLRLRLSRERLASAATSSAEEWMGLVRGYLDSYLAWDLAHGWHGLWGWDSWTLGGFTGDARFPVLAGRLQKSWGDGPAMEERFEAIARDLSARHDVRAVREGAIRFLREAVLAAKPVATLAQKARASASTVPEPGRYPPSAAVDGILSTPYWPGGLVTPNAEWLQLDWDAPQPIGSVTVHFLQHPSMKGRTIRLQAEVRPGTWEDIATAVIPDAPAAPYAVAAFRLPERRSLKAIRIVNLLDLFEVEAD